MCPPSTQESSQGVVLGIKSYAAERATQEGAAAPTPAHGGDHGFSGAGTHRTATPDLFLRREQAHRR
eukprot:scaffold18425_cov112-Isochrysis_galbana.AAC.6